MCKKCNKAYKRNYLLKEHMRTHSGKNPFVCTVCGKAFARKLNMQVHMRTHSGEKHVSNKIKSIVKKKKRKKCTRPLTRSEFEQP